VLLALSALTAAIGLLTVLGQWVPVSSSTFEVVVIVGMAVGVDYSLFYLRREREERARGKSFADVPRGSAVVKTMNAIQRAFPGRSQDPRRRHGRRGADRRHGGPRCPAPGRPGCPGRSRLAPAPRACLALGAPELGIGSGMASFAGTAVASTEPKWLTYLSCPATGWVPRPATR
jgi:hypothetical protein